MLRKFDGGGVRGCGRNFLRDMQNYSKKSPIIKHSPGEFATIFAAIRGMIGANPLEVVP
jgi:hypothetical protein